MSGKSTTISNIQPMAGNLRVQTAVYGAVIPLVYGRTRISGNLVWYNGFTAIPHTTTTSSGGKGGGGVTQSNTDFTYTAALILALCEGVLNGVVSAWKGKARYTGIPVASSLVAKSVTSTIAGGGMVTVSDYVGNIQVSDGQPDPYDFWANRDGGWN